MNQRISQSSRHNKDDDESALPEFFMLEILVRLRVKDLFKFKCVSKQWFSTISDLGFPTFYASHASHASHESSASYTAWTLIAGGGGLNEGTTDLQYEEILRYNYAGNSSSASPILQSFFSTFKGKSFILAMSYGLLLCWMVKEEKHYVCNPITRKFVALPPIPLPIDKPRISELYKHSKDHVIFDTKVEAGIVTGYNVVNLKIDRHNAILELGIFWSKTGEWTSRKVHCPKDLFLLKARFEPIVVNGILYVSDENKALIRYDLESKKQDDDDDQYYNCQCIPLPRNWNDDPFVSLYKIWQGEFKYIKINGAYLEDDLSLGIWVLKDQNSGPVDDQCWKLERKVKLSNYIKAADGYPAIMNDQHPSVYIEPSYFHPLDISYVYLWFCNASELLKIVGFAVCDLRTGKLEEIYRRNSTGGSYFPYFIPPWPTPIPQPSSIKFQ